MSRRRLFILIFGPIPIVIASLALTRWARSDATPVVARNQIVVDSNTRFEPRSSSETFDDRLEAECLAVAESLGHRLGHGCSWIVRAPFVIAGDFPPVQLDHWYRQAIGPATRALRRSYFDKMPDAPVTLLLFDGQASYENYARTLYGEEGISVFGYYKPAERVLVANLHTGGGTLVHELTHALIDFDFGNVPDWFNEGLASMHESRASLDESGIDGLINWRLPILQQALEQGRCGPWHR